jgi:hypothetical protein
MHVSTVAERHVRDGFMVADGSVNAIYDNGTELSPALRGCLSVEQLSNKAYKAHLVFLVQSPQVLAVYWCLCRNRGR